MAVNTQGLSAGTLKEIQRKAEYGEQMSAPTAQKQALYDAYQKQATQRVQQAAQSGQALATPNDWKNKVYQDYQVAQMKTDYNSPYNVDQRNQTQLQSQQALNSQNVQSMLGNITTANTGKLQAMEELLRTQSTSSLESQLAQLGMAREQQIAELQRAMEQAVQEGEMSVREAEGMFESAKKEIDAQHYNDAESTRLYAQEMGLANSNQSIGLMQGDQARANSAVNSSRSERDGRIADIKNRIAQIKSSNATDVSLANAQYNYGVAGAQAENNAQLAQNLTQLYNTDMQQTNANAVQFGMGELEMNNQLQNQYLGNQYQTQQAQLAQQMQMALMAQEQKYNQQNMATQQKMTLEQFAVQHGYDLTKMNAQQKYQLEQMAVNQGYTIENAVMQQGFTQDNMAMQHGFNVDMSNLGFAQDREMANIAFQNQSALSEQEYGQAVNMAEKEASLAVEQERKSYELAVERELQGLTPGTNEYKIKQGKLNDEMNAYLTELHAATRYESMAKSIYGEDAPVKPTQKGALWWKESDADYKARVKEYEKELKAYNSKVESWEGSANPLAPATP